MKHGKWPDDTAIILSMTPCWPPADCLLTVCWPVVTPCGGAPAKAGTCAHKSHWQLLLLRCSADLRTKLQLPNFIVQNARHWTVEKIHDPNRYKTKIRIADGWEGSISSLKAPAVRGRRFEKDKAVLSLSLVLYSFACGVAHFLEWWWLIVHGCCYQIGPFKLKCRKISFFHLLSIAQSQCFLICSWTSLRKV